MTTGLDERLRALADEQIAGLRLESPAAARSSTRLKRSRGALRGAAAMAAAAALIVGVVAVATQESSDVTVVPAAPSPSVTRPEVQAAELLAGLEDSSWTGRIDVAAGPVVAVDWTPRVARYRHPDSDVVMEGSATFVATGDRWVTDERESSLGQVDVLLDAARSVPCWSADGDVLTGTWSCSTSGSVSLRPAGVRPERVTIRVVRGGIGSVDLETDDDGVVAVHLEVDRDRIGPDDPDPLRGIVDRSSVMDEQPVGAVGSFVGELPGSAGSSAAAGEWTSLVVLAPWCPHCDAVVDDLERRALSDIADLRQVVVVVTAVGPDDDLGPFEELSQLGVRVVFDDTWIYNGPGLGESRFLDALQVESFPTSVTVGNSQVVDRRIVLRRASGTDGVTAMLDRLPRR